VARTRRRTVEEERVWQEVRRVVIARDEGRCVECGIVPPSGEADVHHLIPRADGGQDEASNCVLLCDGCHAGHHPNLQVSLARRMIKRWALRLALWLDFRRELPEETRALQAGLELFGVDRFRDGQLDVVLAALSGESLLVVRPTGSGKSLCFQLPAVLKGQPTTFVLSPTKALQVDQTMALHKKQLPASFVNGDIRGREKALRYELLEHGALAMIYLTPERFGTMVRPDEVARLSAQRPSFLVVDEAHCVDAWGQDFRPDYGRIGELRHRLGDPPVLALTATAGLESQRRILESLDIEGARVLMSDVDRPNIALARLQEPDDAKRAQIVARLLAQLEGRALIFVPTEREGRKVQAAMAAAGYQLEFFFGRLDKLERDSLQNRFSGRHEEPLRILITTTAFGMGVDIPDVRLVVHWLHSHTVEDYLQEFGRAGRDGQPALALLFTKGRGDLGLLEWMARSSSDEAVKKRTLSAGAAGRNLQRRLERLDLLQSLVADRQHCFRAGLMEVLQGPRRRVRRSLARRLLDLVLGRRSKITPAGVCCDFCNPQLATAARGGQLVLDGRAFSSHGAGHRRAKPARSRAPRPPRSRLTQLGHGLQAAVAVVVGVVALYIGVGFVELAIDALSPDSPSTKAAHIFTDFVSSPTGANPYGTPDVRPFHGYFIACARAQHRGDGSLCLLVHPDRPFGQRVTGSYRKRGDRRVDCTDAAERLRLCGRG
jgi:RecQ family ATP-dependent DNA helicase